MWKIFISIILSILLVSVSAKAQFIWSKTTHDFGQVQKNVPANYEFKFSNYTGRSMKISFVKTSCTCVTPKWENSVVNPNEFGRFRVSITPSRTGSFQETIEVFTESNPYPEKLTIKGYVGEDSFAPTTTVATTTNTSVSTSPRPSSKPTTPETTPTATPSAIPGKRPKLPASTTTATPSTTIAPYYLAGTTLNTAAAETYMSEREKAMIQEVNLLRSNPKGYIQVVDAFVKILQEELKNDPTLANQHNAMIQVAKELISELSQTESLSILQPDRGIYLAARSHGAEAKRTGSLTPQSVGGTMPWDRIKSYAPNINDANENIIGGIENIRRTIVTLLLSANDINRGHRKNLLSPRWDKIACHDVGTVGTIPNMWIQDFGELKVGAKPENTPPAPYKPSLPQSYEQPVSKPTVDPTLPPARPSISNPPSTNTLPPSKPNVPNPPPPEQPKSTTAAVLNTSLAPAIKPEGQHNTAIAATYMKAEEKLMLQEINFIRANPKGYIPVVEAYIDFMEKEIAANPSNAVFYKQELIAANELLGLLERLAPMSILFPDPNLYKAAKIHGDESKVRGNLEAKGSDGSSPWSRIIKFAPNMMDGNENIVAGPSDIRKSVLKALVDEKDNLRNSRKVILNPKWHFLACYYIGSVGTMPNNWIQSFAQARPGQEPVIKTTSTPTAPTPSNVAPVPAQPSASPNTTTNIAPNYLPSPALLNTTGNITYLTGKEQMMVREVNLVRSNPKNYISVVEYYLNLLEGKKQKDPSAAAYYDAGILAGRELIGELQKLQPLPLVQPNAQFSTVAKNHGDDMKISGSFSHVGSNGSSPWTRLAKGVDNLADGNECLTYLTEDPREAILQLLLDNGIPSRDNRKILLNPNWEYIGVSDAGAIGKRNNCWILTLGRKK